ncbi:MAG TPA: DUF6580 family putative transport protein [Candidatus Methylacidiphilales bacterium]|nr:DUF6580 family putative transport protein [Candidatus Methylacidiphilales bacterium]
MKREIHPVYIALFLIFGCALFRLTSSRYPEVIPDISPFMAVAYVGGICLPRRWGWLIGAIAIFLSDFAFLEINSRTIGAMFSWWSVISFGIYAGAGLLGIVVVRHASLFKTVAGSLGCSLFFYVAANTFSWRQNIVLKQTPGYPPTLAGWWQANTIGLPGYEPTWLFLRNGMAGDLFFVFLLLFILNRSLLFGQTPIRAVSGSA